MSSGRATFRDYDVYCRYCRYNLRGLPPDSVTSWIRCPECGCETMDPVVRSERAALAFHCVKCGYDLHGLPRMVGSGVYFCPTCGTRKLAFSGVFPNHRICDHDLKCRKCRRSLRGAVAPPGGELVACPECGRWNSPIDMT